MILQDESWFELTYEQTTEKNTDADNMMKTGQKVVI